MFQAIRAPEGNTMHHKACGGLRLAMAKNAKD